LRTHPVQWGMRSGGWLITLAATCLLLSGCGEKAKAVETNGATVLVAGNQSGGSDVRIVGTIREINGCLGLELGENRWIAVFPAGSEVAEDGLSVTLSNGSELKVGDKVEASGEFYRRRPPENAPAVPERCGEFSAALLNEPHVLEAGN
jgi:hypothetical protein